MIRKSLIVLSNKVKDSGILNRNRNNLLRVKPLSNNFTNQKQQVYEGIQNQQDNNNKNFLSIRNDNNMCYQQCLRQKSLQQNNNQQWQQSLQKSSPQTHTNSNKKSSLISNHINIHKQNKQLLLNYGLNDDNNNSQHAKQSISKSMSYKFDEQHLKKMLQMKYYYSDIVNVASFVIQELMIGNMKVGRTNYEKVNILQQNHHQGQESHVRRELLSSSSLSESISISTQIQNHISPITTTTSISPTHIHFLLYVYHLYPRQCKQLKQRITILIEYFIDSNNKNVNMEIKDNMQMLFYLRKFIENEQYHKLNQHIRRVNVKYSKWLKLKYEREKKQLGLSILEINKDNDINIDVDQSKYGKQMTIKLQLLHNYLLVFPNLWNMPPTTTSLSTTTTKKSNVNNIRNSNKRNNNNNIEDLNSQNQIKSQQKKSMTTTNSTNTIIPLCQLVQVFNYFVNQFTYCLTQIISHWQQQQQQVIPNNNNDNIKEYHHSSPNVDISKSNTSYKKLLQQQFKQTQLKQCIDLVRLLTHRLFVICDPPHNYSSFNVQNQHSHQQQHDQKYLLQQLVNKYCLDKINLLTYLPNKKMKSQQQLISTLILVKHLIASYHTVRNISNQHITNYLLKLFKNNQHLIIDTKNHTFKRQINHAINQLVSKLASSSYIDANDQLSKYLVVENYQSISQFNKSSTFKEKKKIDNNNNDSSWYSVNSQ